MGNAIARLTAARFDGPQALYTEAVRLLSERPALPDDLAAREPQCAAVKPLAWITLEASDWLRVYDGPACAKITAIHRVPPKSGMGVPVYSEPLTIRPEAEVRAEAWVEALEAGAEAADAWFYDSQEDLVTDNLLGNEIRTLTPPADISAALDRLKAEAKAEGMRIGAAREKMRALTEWLNDDEDNGELLMASLDGDAIETLRAILAAITEGRK